MPAASIAAAAETAGSGAGARSCGALTLLTALAVLGALAVAVEPGFAVPAAATASCLPVCALPVVATVRPPVLCRKPAVVTLFAVVVVDDHSGAGRGRQEDRGAEDGPTTPAHPGRRARKILADLADFGSSTGESGVDWGCCCGGSGWDMLGLLIASTGPVPAAAISLECRC